MSKKKRNILLYIFLSLSILMNAFLVFQAALPPDSSLSWSSVALNVAKTILPTTEAADGTIMIGDNNASDLVRKLVGHFSFYLIDGVFVSLYSYYQFYYSNNKKWTYIIAATVGLFFSVLTELVQMLVPGRSGDVIDMLINLAGFVLGSGIVFMILFLIGRHKNKVIE